MPVYAVETDQGTFEIEVDREIPDTLRGRALMQRLVAEQIRAQESRAFDRQNFPVATAVSDVGRGVVPADAYADLRRPDEELAGGAGMRMHPGVEDRAAKLGLEVLSARDAGHESESRDEHGSYRESHE